MKPVNRPAALLARFVQSLEHGRSQGAPPLTVGDLRLAIRQQRLTEISAWTFQELDDVEEEAAPYGGTTVLIDIVSSPTPGPVLQIP